MSIPPFYISSRGHSATAWIARSLSKHPEIICFHGTRSIPPKSSGTVPDMTPDEFIDALITCSVNIGNKTFGAIHGFYGTICKQAVERKGGKFCAIIRQPIKRIHSCFIHSHKSHIIPPGHEEQNKISSKKIYTYIADQKMDKVLDRRNAQGELLVSETEKVFFHYCKTLIYFDLACVQECGIDLNFKMEDLVSSTKEFIRFFNYITQKKIPCTDAYIESINFENKINRHTRNETSEEIYEAWPTSFKYLFHLALNQNNAEYAHKTYKRYGYTIPEKRLDEFNPDNF